MQILWSRYLPFIVVVRFIVSCVWIILFPNTIIMSMIMCVHFLFNITPFTTLADLNKRGGPGGHDPPQLLGWYSER